MHAREVSPLYARAIGHEHEAYKVFLPQGAEKPVVVPYVKRYPPDTSAARFWLMNRQRNLWKERQEVAVADPLASMTPEQRLAQVVNIMARARALLDQRDPNDDDDAIDAEIDTEYEEMEE